VTTVPRRLPILAAAAALLSCQGVSRVEVDPAAVQLWSRGQTARVRAVALAGNGKALPEKTCAWSSANPRVATVEPAGNLAVLTAAGSGTTAVRCLVGGAAAEIAVSVRLLSRVEVSPSPAALKLLDQPAPLRLEIRGYDEAGGPATPRAVHTRCLDENVCRGDDQGQLWAVGPGSSRAVVEADGTPAEIAVSVADARTAAGKPRAVTGNPMLEYEKAVQIIQREQRQAAGKK
jgi:hypothetical protein